MKTNLLIRALTFASIAISFAPPAIAAETIDSRITSYVTGAEVKKSLLQVAVMWDKMLGINCSESYDVEIKPENIFLVSPMSMGEADKHPTEGIWSYRFAAKRCGEAKYYNVAFLGNKSTPPKLIALIPGQTMASPQLVLDTVNQVSIAIKSFTDAKQGTKCDDFAFTDSTVNIPPAAGNPRSQFEEVWSYRYCGNIKPITVCFSPNQETGGMSFRTTPCKDTPIPKNQSPIDSN
jgi:hypothetical protein